MRARYLYIIALAVVILDQFTKYLVEAILPIGTSIPLIGRALCLTAVHNRGGAFGIMQSWTGVLTFVTIAVVIAIIVLSRRGSVLPAIVGVALALELGGAVGNLIDRVRFGYVIDFIDFRVWPVFNLADCAITVGIIFLAYYLLLGERARAKAHLAATPATKDS